MPRAPTQTATRTIFLVRHAEKLDESPGARLSPTGHARARRLSDLLGQAGIQRIFVSEFERTQQTAGPIAERLGIQPLVVPAQDRQVLHAQLVSSNSGEGAILVVGHSDTLPRILADLGLPVPPIPGGDYGNLFVVVLPPRMKEPQTPPSPASAPTLIRLRY